LAKIYGLGTVLFASALALGAAGCGSSGTQDTTQPPPDATFFVLSGVPDPSTVFDSIEVTFTYPNNLTNGIWHQNSNMILVGDYTESGYWSHPANAGGYPADPDHGMGGFRRLVQMPLTNMVAYTVTPDNDGIGASLPPDVRLATIDRYSGALGSEIPAQFSDAYVGQCSLLSSSADELLVLENSTTIRRYRTNSGSGMLDFLGTVTLSQALPSTALGDTGHNYGGTFAWDGVYYYFTLDLTSNTGLDYAVYDASGNYVATHTAMGGGAIDGVYFDWSVGRYAIHDGFGGSDSDSQCYSPVSANHTLVP
jgi:hypothetical protein